MREVSVFYAFDDTEFFDRNECECYEERATLMIFEACEAYQFFDENGEQIEIDLITDLETTLFSFNMAWGKCSYIRVTKDVSSDTKNFIYTYFGFSFPDEMGLYRYWYNGDEWHKVDD